MGCVIRAEGLSKRFGETIVFEKTSFCVEEGLSVIWAPNASGKTTLIKLALGLLKPDKGVIELGGFKRLGVAFEEPPAPPHVRAIDVIEAGFLSKGVGPDEAEMLEVARKLGLGREHLGKRLAALSSGTLRKVILAHALVGDPDLVILDEPFAGLDPSSRIGLSTLVNDLAARGRDVVVSTHILSLLEPTAVYTIAGHKVLGPFRVTAKRPIMGIDPRTGESRLLSTSEARRLYHEGYIILDA